MAKFEILWEAPEFEYREKEVSWYWVSIIAASLIVGFSVWQKDFLFGFFIVIAEVLFIVWGNREPRAIQFALTDEELVIGNNKVYLLKEFDGWSANADGEEWTDIMMHFRSKVRPPFTIMAPSDRMGEIRSNLKTVAKELEHQPSLVDSIEKFLRF